MLDEVVRGQSDSLDDLFPVVIGNHDSGASLVSERFSESHCSSNENGRMEDQNPPVSWREPKRERKIQTTSLSLRRRKLRNKQREPRLIQTHKVLRLRGGGFDDGDGGVNSKQDENKSDDPCNNDDLEMGNREQKPPPKKRLRTRNYKAVDWPDQLTAGSCFEKSRQKPAPMDLPREQDLSFGNMTTDCIESEDGREIFSPLLDSYRRTDAQVEAVKDAGADQRKVGGGVYQNKVNSQMFFTIRRGCANQIKVFCNDEL